MAFVFISLIFVTVSFAYPFDIWHETVYYSPVEGSEAQIIISHSRGRYDGDWQEINLFDFPTAEWDYQYRDFERYDHRHISAFGYSILLYTGPKGITDFRLLIPGCCVEPSLGAYMPQFGLSYDRSSDTGLHFVKWPVAEWLR